MAYERLDENPLDYQFCRYGQSRMLFRGPKRNLKKPYFAFIGGTETFGKYVERPFSHLIEEQTEVQAVNLGVVNAGVDAFVKDQSVLELCNKSKATVIQAMGAQNMSNRFYSVHPRRNDRFLKASPLLQTIYREVDFTEFSFTRHMLMALKTISEEKFEIVAEELRAAWVARMEHLLKSIAGPKVVLWLCDARRPECHESPLLGADPLYVSSHMIDKVRGFATDVIKVDISEVLVPDTTLGMLYPSREASAAQSLPGPEFHAFVADALGKALE